MDNKSVIKSLKTNNVLLFKQLESKILMYLQNTTNIENAATFYQLARFINIPNFSQLIKNYVHRCFTMVAETENFLKLDFSFVAKILSSEQLNITTELEVFKAADNWLNYNVLERSKFAKELLFTVRLPLLSDHALNSVLCKDSSFRNSEECLVLVKDILEDKLFHRNGMNFSCTTRYCDQSMFNILTFGSGYLLSPKLVRYDINNKELTTLKYFPQPNRARKYVRAIFLNGEFYVVCFTKSYGHSGMSVQKFFSKTNSWEVVADYSDKYIENFGVCVFMGKVYLVGGMISYEDTDENATIIQLMNNCFEFNPVNREVREVKRMNGHRYTNFNNFFFKQNR